MTQKIIALAIPLEDHLLAPLHHWGQRFDWSHVEEVHLIHVVKKVIMSLEFSIAESPTAEVFEEMLPTIHKHLENEAKKIIPAEFKGKLVYHVSCDYDPEDRVVAQLKACGAALIVVATHGRKGFEGLFHSSFTDHMIKFAPCDVYVVRPEKK